MTTPNLMALTSMVPTVLVSRRIGVTTDSAVYTVPSNKAVKITQGSLCNTSVSTVTVGLSIVPSGGTIGDGTHKIFPDTFPIAAGDTINLIDWLGGYMLGDGDIIACHASATGSIDVVISGVVMT